jgi:hypothetical protein
MAWKYIYQYIPFQGPQKYTQTGIFGMKIGLISGNPAMNS